MIIGVYYKHIKNKRTTMTMVATINNTFNDFFNKEEIIEEQKQEQLYFCISSFIEEAIEVYKKENKEKPNGIIIYRQGGLSLQQKECLKNEIIQIKLKCESKKLLFYYILVNKIKVLNYLKKQKKYIQILNLDYQY